MYTITFLRNFLQEITELENFEEEDLPDVTTLVGSNIMVNFKS